MLSLSYFFLDLVTKIVILISFQNFYYYLDTNMDYAFLLFRYSYTNIIETTMNC